MTQGVPAEMLRFEHAGFTGERSPGLDAKTLGQVIEHVECMPFGSDDFTRKRRRYQEIGRVRLGGADLAVKRWRHPLGLPLGSPARRTAACWRILRDSGAPTPELVAVLDAARGTRSFARSMLITSWLPAHRPLNLYCAGHRPYGARLRPSLGSIAELVATMHAGGAGHADLRLENIMAAEGEGGRLEDFFLVDVDEVRSRDPLDLRRAARDLGNLVFHLRRIDIPDHTSMRILVHYGRTRELHPDQLRRLARSVFAAATWRWRLRQARRVGSWLPAPRARTTRAATRETLHRFYGIDGELGAAAGGDQEHERV